jgi:hypothetical protein
LAEHVVNCGGDFITKLLYLAMPERRPVNRAEAGDELDLMPGNESSYKRKRI